MMKQKAILTSGALLLCIVSFQNCAKAQFATTTDSASTTTDGIPDLISGTTSTTTTTDSLKVFKPVLAVGGINCMACHGNVNANIVTDFGMSSGNFQSDRNFFGNGVRTAYNDVDYSGLGGWGSLKVVGGSIIVPKLSLSSNQMNSMSGIAQSMSLAKLMATPIQAHSMIDLVSPPAGQNAVIEYSSIHISYPSENEILNLIPSSSASSSVQSINVAGQAASSMSGLAIDASGKFVRNTSSVISCFGDVVVKGPLFLKDVTIKTDDGGCRLYVSQSAFIQGPVKYQGTANANLQITSARAVSLGISAERMGYAGAGASSVRYENSSLKTAGGPWARFLPSNDTAYSPLNPQINGVARSTFFDNVVRDAVLIGSELLDAGDAAAVNNLAADESVSSEAASGENANQAGSRVSIDYSHLLLNAPHVHSRYAGTFQGTIVADVAMLARNPSTKQIEQFTFDPVFEKVTAVLPALKTVILNLQQ